MVCESSAEDQLQPVSAPYRVVKRYQYGRTAVTIITKGETE